MDHAIIRKVPWEGLEKATNGFSKENYIGTFQFGKVYRGKLDSRDVTVKIWEEPKIYYYFEQDNEDRLRAEVFLLQHEKLNSHPNLVKLLGYCCEGRNKLGVVYDLKPLDTVHNLILKDSFTWPQRIKVALGFARLLDFLNTGSRLYLPTLVRNIDAAHIMLDEEYNPMLYDFSMICCGILPNWSDSKTERLSGSYGYIDIYCQGIWYLQRDVFSFGVLLLCLMAKRIYTNDDRLNRVPYIFQWAEKEYKLKKSMVGVDKFKFSLVHESFKKDPSFYPGDGPKITRLALLCTKRSACRRPLMNQVVKHLLNLRIVQSQARALGVHEMIYGQSYILRKLNPAGSLLYLNFQNAIAEKRLYVRWYMLEAKEIMKIFIWVYQQDAESFVRRRLMGKKFRDVDE